jgi:phosphatidylglycerol:prolipoprotein diacylglycerol transferase
MSFIGGGIGVLIALFLFRFFFHLSRKEFLLLFDIILVLVPLGILLGRFGNYLNQELYGISVQVNGFPQFIWPTAVINVLWELGILHIYPNVDGNVRVNTNLLSMLFEGVCLLVVNGAILFRMLKKRFFKI